MTYTGRLVITSAILALVVIVRLYGNLFYNYPVLKVPSIGIVAVLISWWFGSQYDKVKFYSENDILTGIYNRRYVYRIFPKMLARIGKRNESATLFLIDVDNFKQINDTHGHQTGDRVLQHIARILIAHTSKKDIVARWAGDEFLIVSPCSNQVVDDEMMNQIKEELRELSKEIGIEVSVSIGTSVYPNDAASLDSLLNIADRKMYEMKQ